MADVFEGKGVELDSPAANAAAVTAGVDLDQDARALWVGTGGDVALLTSGGNTVTLRNVPDGMILPIRVRRVVVAGTTAADFVALW